jgi:hypothetical protein
MLKGKSLWEQLRPLLAKVPAARGKKIPGRKISQKISMG